MTEHNRNTKAESFWSIVVILVLVAVVLLLIEL